jgi:hypothetical protein
MPRDKQLTQNGARVQKLLNAIQPPIGTSQPAGGFLPNIFYALGTLLADTTFSLAAPAQEDANIVNHYYWTFETGSTVPDINLPAGITWIGGEAPTFEENTHYEISVLNGIGAFMSVEIEQEGE